MPHDHDLSEYVASTWTCLSENLPDALDACRQAGFEDVELWADVRHLDPRADPDIHQVARRLQANGQRVHSVHLPILHPFPHPMEEQAFFAYRLALHKKTIDWAERLGCTIGVLHAFDPHFYPYRLDQLDVLRERLAQLARYARQRGVRLAVENMPYHPAPGQMTTSLTAQRAYFEDLDVYYCLDIGHVPLLGQATCQGEIDAATPRLITFHVHNNWGAQDDHNPPDAGILDWPHIRAYARKKGYAGKFVLEVNERGDGAAVLRGLAAQITGPSQRGETDP